MQSIQPDAPTGFFIILNQFQTGFLAASCGDVIVVQILQVTAAADRFGQEQSVKLPPCRGHSMDHNNGTHDPALYERLKALPKIELHRHLEGSLRLSTLVEVARRHNMDFPVYDAEIIRPMVQITDKDATNAAAYLSKFAVLRSFYQSPDMIDRVVYEAVEDAAAENIVYFELRFTPIALTREKGYALEDVTDWVIAAVNRAKQKFGIEVRLIASMNRHESVEQGQQVADIAIDRMDRGIVGLDLAGAEGEHPGTQFAPIFEKAREAGLAVTIHAGEWRGPESIALAIETLNAMRLGHGVRVVEDSKVLQMARERQIAFEVCPTSNIQSGVVRSFASHPLRDMYQIGLLTTINTDNTSVSGINLTDEYFRAMQYLGFSLDDIKRHVLNAAKASFLPPAAKEQLVSRLSAEFQPNTAHTN